MKLQCTRRSIVCVTAQKEAELLQLGVPDPLDGAAQHPSAESLEAICIEHALASGMGMRPQHKHELQSMMSS